ncbi:MAG: NAD(P)/FAD-dependent oxidoreductase, partial [Lachnospiraceae bacterium]|nr:NAD(P)/FAD-dependent oxidoreductase [Lachnospiraceae bacterium]
MIHEVVVAGGGASGMMAAITAAGRGKKVTILEHMDRLGKKILMTGNGRCNYSNINQNISCYRTSDKGFVEDVLNKFSQREATEFFKQNGIVTKNRNGYLYPNSGQASVINDILRIKCEN